MYPTSIEVERGAKNRQPRPFAVNCRSQPARGYFRPHHALNVCYLRPQGELARPTRAPEGHAWPQRLGGPFVSTRCPRTGRWHDFSRPFHWCSRHDGGRGGVQYRDDRVSGDPDGPVLLPPDCHAHLSSHRQHGRNREDEESTGIQAAGLIIRDLPLLASNFRSEQSLSDYLNSGDTVAIADIDTRKLTRILRDGGAQSGCIMAGPEASETEALERRALSLASREWTSLRW